MLSLRCLWVSGDSQAYGSEALKEKTGWSYRSGSHHHVNGNLKMENHTECVYKKGKLGGNSERCMHLKQVEEK